MKVSTFREKLFQKYNNVILKFHISATTKLFNIILRKD
jgi:hypothetical protein